MILHCQLQLVDSFLDHAICHQIRGNAMQQWLCQMPYIQIIITETSIQMFHTFCYRASVKHRPSIDKVARGDFQQSQQYGR